MSVNSALSRDCDADHEPPASLELRGIILEHVFRALEGAGIQYCVLHGYEGYPHQIGSDVDLLVLEEADPRQLCAAISRAQSGVRVHVVRCRGHEIVVAAIGEGGHPCFLTLDFHVDCALGAQVFYSGPEALAKRTRLRGYWVLPTEMDFGAYLARSIALGSLDERRTDRLSNLFQTRPEECAREAQRLFSPHHAEMLASAAASRDWSRVEHEIPKLRDYLSARSRRQYPFRTARAYKRNGAKRLARWLQPDGLSIAFLGPDGAGKSTAADTLVEGRFEPLFERTASLGFAPPLHRLWGVNRGPSSEPHALPPRALWISMARAAYWFAYYSLGYLFVRRILSSGGLLTFDRHFVDILVDPKRYRYRGPAWPMRLIWALIPRPNLIVLLDAPAEMVHARKQEVPLAETRRQRTEYLRLVSGLANGRIVNASHPLPVVQAAVARLVLEFLEERLVHRMELRVVVGLQETRRATP